jgi:hypothetical protein
MTDAQLADFLGLEDEPPEAVARCIATMDPKTRAAYERMAEVCADLGMGVVPEGVMVCRPRQRGRR